MISSLMGEFQGRTDYLFTKYNMISLKCKIDCRAMCKQSKKKKKKNIGPFLKLKLPIFKEDNNDLHIQYTYILKVKI